MCRLFGMHAGPKPVRATFWLLTAPDSLAEQSRRMADGFGIGVFNSGGKPVVDKAPMPAYEDRAYASAARTLEGSTFVAHVRYASTGGNTMVNTHPFLQDDRLLAHNGVVEDLDVLDDRLRSLEVLGLVQGETDSERVFALITGIARQNGGDLGDAITQAVTWVAENLRLYAVNLVLSTESELWAVRYPAMTSTACCPDGARKEVHPESAGRPVLDRRMAGTCRNYRQAPAFACPGGGAAAAA